MGEVGSLGQSQSESQPGQMGLQAGEMGSPGQGQSGRSQARQSHRQVRWGHHVNVSLDLSQVNI